MFGGADVVVNNAGIMNVGPFVLDEVLLVRMFNPRDEARSRLRSLAFMSPRDIGLFLRSARTDALIAQTRELSGNASAFEAAYAGGDPWASGDPRYFYQRRKYEILLRLLPDTAGTRACWIWAVVSVISPAAWPHGQMR